MVICLSNLNYNTAVSKLTIRETNTEELVSEKNRALFTKAKAHKRSNRHKNKKCYHCKKKGHIAIEFSLVPRQKNYKGTLDKNVTAQRVNYDESLDRENTAMVTRTCAFVSKNKRKASARWMLDPACTTHIYNKQKFYSHVREAIKSNHD